MEGQTREITLKVKVEESVEDERRVKGITVDLEEDVSFCRISRGYVWFIIPPH